MKRLLPISLLVVTVLGGIALGAPAIAANSANAVVLPSLTPNLIAPMIAPGICRVQQHDTHLIPTRLLSNEISDHGCATAAML